MGLRITDPDLRRLFRTVHGDLLEVEHWQGIQNELENGKVPQIQVYPDSSSLGLTCFRTDVPGIAHALITEPGLSAVFGQEEYCE